MKIYKAKPIALPTISEVEGELYVDVDKTDFNVTDKYYIREHFTIVDNDKIKICHNDYRIDVNTLEEVTNDFER